MSSEDFKNNNNKSTYQDFKQRQLQEDKEQEEQNNNNNYEDQNKILRELAEERAKRNAQKMGTIKNENQQNIEKQSQQQQQQQQKNNNKNENQFEQYKGENHQQQQKQDQYQQQQQQQQQQKEQNKSIHTQKLSQFYLNQVENYPKEGLLDYMLDFDNFFYEDPFCKQKKMKEIKNVQNVFMTTYGFDPQFLYEKVASQKHIHFVLANDRTKQDFLSGNVPNVINSFSQCKNWTLIHPPKDYTLPYPGPFHPKLWLLKFPTFLRVVIGSANLTQSDFEIWGQGFWFQDFPRKNLSQMDQNQDKQQQQQNEEEEEEKNNFDFNKDFKESLILFVTKLMPAKTNYKELLKIDLEDYIYENINIILIPGVPGRHTGKEMLQYNKAKIKHVLSQFKQYNSSIKNPILTYQSSSLGRLDQDQVDEQINTFTPGSQSYKDMKAARTSRKKNKLPSPYEKNFKLVYPTLQYLMDEQSGCKGPDHAAVLFLQKSNFDLPTFPKQSMHRFQGNQEEYYFHDGVIPHTKCGILTSDDMEIQDNTVIYFGSHNFTAAAWGKFEKDHQQLFNNNTELGIIFPPRENSKAQKKEFVKSLPFKFPPQKYQTGDRPFMADDQYGPQ